MDANFFYFSIHDRFIQRQPCACAWMCACVCAFVKFFFKNFSSETIDWTFTKFYSSFPLIEVKIFSSSLQKNQACGAIQAVKGL